MTAPPNRVWEHSFFFTPFERDRISKEKVEYPPSITTKLFHPLWFKISEKLIPETVAPNAISLLGALFALQAYQVVERYYDTMTTPATNAAVVLLLLSVVCSSVDGVHAARCRSSTALGLIFSKIMSSMRHLFLALTLFPVLGIRSPMVQWYLIMAIQLIQLSNMFYIVDDIEERRLMKKKRNPALHVVRLGKSIAYLFNITEASLFEIGILVGRHYLAPHLDAIAKQLNQTVGSLTAVKESLVETTTVMESMVKDYTGTKIDFWAPEDVAALVFYAAASICAFTLLIMRCPQGLSKWALWCSILARAFPISFLPLWDSSQMGLIADGAMLGLLSIEVHVSSVARRRIHSAVFAIIVCSMGSGVFGIVSAMLYIVGMLADLAYSTGTPLFVPVRNVYIDGVFDLCHIGHKRLMEYALTHGNRLVVGVLSDEECLTYKRRPVMTLDERCREVASCKWVAEVIPYAPNGVTEAFIEKHNIHICVYGEEYEKPDDKYYVVPRRLGIGRLAPRTQGMSTSEIIRRISTSAADDLAAKDKLIGGSTVKE